VNIQPLLEEIDVLKTSLDKFERGNKSAGTRARKSLQTIKKIAQELRIEIQETIKSQEE
jgi:transcriptional regulator with XRE-family HTH domain